MPHLWAGHRVSRSYGWGGRRYGARACASASWAEFAASAALCATDSNRRLARCHVLTVAFARAAQVSCVAESITKEGHELLFDVHEQARFELLQVRPRLARPCQLTSR